jgi:hypothetical protein
MLLPQQHKEKAESRIQEPEARIKTEAVFSLFFWILDADS